MAYMAYVDDLLSFHLLVLVEWLVGCCRMPSVDDGRPTEIDNCEHTERTYILLT